MKTILLSATMLATLTTTAFAGEIIIGGRFANYTTGVEYGTWPADTSDAPAGTLIDFNTSILFPSLKTLSFTTPTYGAMTDTFTHLDYAFTNSSGLFYEETNATGFLDVNIIYPGHGISSFSFTDYGVAPPPPPIDPPPSCLIDCGGITPPPSIGAAPEASTWLMLIIGFSFLGFQRSTVRLFKSKVRALV